ncbi:DUF6221 family protein [Lentzea sp. NPDC092896]|uniref:DUF6221 family protein n=1 Tax=Lentzea sp. NPDC092896 TaxID=3364127 RepID=UPI003828B248
MTSDDLVPRILAAIEAVEALVEQVAEEVGAEWSDGGELGNSVWTKDGSGYVAAGPYDYMSRELRQHIAHHDPASVLRRCEVDRRTVERHSTITDAVFSTSPGKPGVWLPKCFYCNRRAPCDDLRDMADRYGITEEEHDEDIVPAILSAGQFSNGQGTVELDADGRLFLLVCRECDVDEPIPFSSAEERGKWAAGHRDATGHDSWWSHDHTSKETT